MEEKELYETNDRDHRLAILSIIRGGSNDELMRTLLEDYHANDIAAVFDELTEEEKKTLMRALGNETMAEIVSYLDDASDIIEQMDADDAAEIIEQMDADDALDVLETLDEDKRQEVFDRIEDGVKHDIEMLDSYDDDEFGSVMSTNFISISRSMSIKDAMRHLISEAPENDNIFTIFVTDNDGSFYGAINLKELIVARSDKPLEELIYTNFPYVYDTESISENIEGVRGYSEELIPVISEKTRKILGVITSHDITEIVDAELGEDYARLAALGSEETVREPLLRSMRKRIPWLIALLFLGLVVSVVVGFFEGVVKELPLIVSFQSLILDMAGNVGTQSLAVTVRAISSEELDGKEKFRFIFKEMRVAFLNGLIIGLCSLLVIGLFLTFIGGHPFNLAFSVAICVGAALCFAMMISGFAGAAIPMFFQKIKIDPAIASGPLITTISDLVAVVSYYELVWLFLKFVNL